METDHYTKNVPNLRLAACGEDESPASSVCNKLSELSDRMDETHSFAKGQFVRWKPGLKNRKFPDYGEPAIIREVLPAPMFDPCEQAKCTGSPYFGEPLTLVLAILDPDGDFLEFRFDGRRFERLR